MKLLEVINHQPTARYNARRLKLYLLLRLVGRCCYQSMSPGCHLRAWMTDLCQCQSCQDPVWSRRAAMTAGWCSSWVAWGTLKCPSLWASCSPPETDSAWAHQVLEAIFCLLVSHRGVFSEVYQWGRKSQKRWREPWPSYTEGCRLPTSQQLQPVSILFEKPRERLLCFPHKLKYSNRTKDWLILNKTCTISNSLRSLMTGDICCNQMKQTTFSWMLDSDSNHCAFYQSVQYHISGHQAKSLSD